MGQRATLKLRMAVDKERATFLYVFDHLYQIQIRSTTGCWLCIQGWIETIGIQLLSASAQCFRGIVTIRLDKPIKLVS